MAINRLQYPITYDEAIDHLLEMARAIIEENRVNVVLGDPRPEVLQWTAQRLQEQKNFILAGKNGI